MSGDDSFSFSGRIQSDRYIGNLDLCMASRMISEYFSDSGQVFFFHEKKELAMYVSDVQNNTTIIYLKNNGDFEGRSDVAIFFVLTVIKRILQSIHNASFEHRVIQCSH